MKNSLFLVLIIYVSTSISGCSELIPKATVLPSFYILNGVNIEDKTAVNEPQRTLDSQLTLTKRQLVNATLMVNLSSATAGFDSSRIMFSRVPYKLEYFAHNEWIDTPARMLTPLIVSKLKANGLFSAVTLTPSAANSHYSLDTQIIRLQQEFFSSPSRERLTVRATLIDNVKQYVIFVHEIDVVVTAKTDNPYGGVVAANEAVQKMLEKLVVFCNEAIINYQY
jgi:cholesterol transport system auxiliary component